MLDHYPSLYCPPTYYPPGWTGYDLYRSMTCCVCGSRVDPAFMDTVLVKKWKRLFAHVLCARAHVEYSFIRKQTGLPPMISISIIEIVDRIELMTKVLTRERCKAEEKRSKRAATILLYLLEMGLLYDVAWPIAALACWLC